MELRQFLTTALRDLIDAVSETAAYAKTKGAEVNPYTLEWREDQGQVVMYDDDSGLLATSVEFDLAISATDSNAMGANAGINVLGVNLKLGTTVEKAQGTETVSRMRFSVPLVLPSSKGKPAKRK